MLTRVAQIERRNVNEEARTIEVAFSSEHPVERWFGSEILDHGQGSIRLDRLQNKGPVLVDHDQRRQVGVVESLSIGSDRVGRAVLRLGRNEDAEREFADILDGIRTHISVGYRVHDGTIKRDPSSADIDDVDAEPTFRIMDWEPMEISIVAVPADPTVGVGRSDSPKGPDDISTRLEAKPMPKEEKRKDDTVVVTQNTVDETAVRSAGVSDERERVREMLELGEKFECRELANEAIQSGMEMREFYQKLGDAHEANTQRKLDELERGETDPVTQLGLSKPEEKRYSLSRALFAMAQQRLGGDAGAFERLAPFEFECHREVQDVLSREANGFFVPYDVQRSVMPLDKRALTAGAATAGAELVGTLHRPQDFIEQLRNALIAARVGVRLLPGLDQDQSIPRKDGGATFGWLAESAAASLSDPVTGALTLSPTTVGGGTQMSRRLLKQGNPAVDAMVIQDLSEGAAEAIDTAVFEGSGVGANPTGIQATSGVGTSTIAAAGNPTHAEAVEFETDVGGANALRGNPAMVTTSAVVGNMKVRTLDAGSGRFLMENGMVNGYPVVVSNELAANRIIFGDFSQVMIAMWGVLDLRPDPYGAADQDALIVRAFQDIDIGVRHAGAFSVNA